MPPKIRMAPTGHSPSPSLVEAGIDQATVNARGMTTRVVHACFARPPVNATAARVRAQPATCHGS